MTFTRCTNCHRDVMDSAPCHICNDGLRCTHGQRGEAMSEPVDMDVGRVVFPARLIGAQVLIEVEREGVFVSGVKGGKQLATLAIRDLLDLVADVLTTDLEDETEEAEPVPDLGVLT